MSYELNHLIKIPNFGNNTEYWGNFKWLSTKQNSAQVHPDP